MKRIGRRGAGAGLVCLALVMTSASTHALRPAGAPLRIANDARWGEHVAGQAIVRFRPGTVRAARNRAVARAGGRIIRHLRVDDHALVAVPGALVAALPALMRQAVVADAFPNRVARVALGAPNDPCASPTPNPPCPGAAWHLGAIAAAPGWDRFPGVYYTSTTKPLIPAAQRVTIAVLDTAAGRNNADFRNSGPSDDRAAGGQLDVAGMNAFGGLPPEFGPASFHGNYVAGLAGATANNAYAVAGVAYHADILPLSVVHGGDGAADSATLADGIIFAHARGARVINLSLGLTNPDPLVSAAIYRVLNVFNPPLVVAAAGNYNNDQPFYPAWFDGVMAIGGSDQKDLKASCSNFGDRISVVAPAKNVLSLGLETPMYLPDCGTSAATPQVSALAALLFAQDSSRTAAIVRSIIEDTADDLGPPGDDHFFGNGRVNVDRALAWGAALANTSGLRATPVRPGGGTSRIFAHASAPAPVAAAELFVDRAPSGSSDIGFPLSPADGSFSSPSETITGSYPSTLSIGAHRIFVRARTATGWGPVASAVLYVDPIAPKIESLEAVDTIRALDAGTVITFDATDDYSTALTYDVEVSLLGQRDFIVWTQRGIAGTAGRQEVTWTPRTLELPGQYRARITLRDEAGNATSAVDDFVLI